MASSLADRLPPQEVDLAVKNIIYLLDLGLFLLQSDVVVANLDETLDPGVDIEMNHAKEMHKFVLGIRTDVRSPYGSSNDHVGGMHFFPAYQCDVLIKHYMPGRSIDSAAREMDELASKVDVEIDKANILQRKNKPVTSAHIKKTIDAANILFRDITEIHPKDRLAKIVGRYIDKQEIFMGFAPKIAS